MTAFIRAVLLDDIRIRSGGTGRTVEAYAAVFDEVAEVVDQDGHYLERNDPRAFVKTIGDHRGGFPVYYHHGLTIAGTPSERGSVPIGVSTEVTTDKRGLRTLSEYHETELADEVLEAIRKGSIRAQSYGGRFMRSDPQQKPPGGKFRRGPSGLRTVTRLEIAMREFGPTPFPAFATADIVGVRAALLGGAQPDPPEDDEDDGTPAADQEVDTDAAAETEAPPRHARSIIPLRTRIRAARITRPGLESAR